MQIWLALANDAKDNGDGTISVDRLGISRLRRKKEGGVFRPRMVVYVISGVGEGGKRTLSFVIVDADGKPVRPEASHEVDVPGKRGGRVVALPLLNIDFPAGDYSIQLRVDGHFQASYDFQIIDDVAPDA